MADRLRKYWDKLQAREAPSARVDFEKAGFSPKDAFDFEWILDNFGEARFDRAEKERRAFEEISIVKRERDQKAAVAKQKLEEEERQKRMIPPSIKLAEVSAIDYHDPSWRRAAKRLADDEQIGLSFDEALEDLTTYDAQIRQFWNDSVKESGGVPTATIFGFGHSIATLAQAQRHGQRIERRKLERRVATAECTIEAFALERKALTDERDALAKRVDDLEQKMVAAADALEQRNAEADSRMASVNDVLQRIETAEQSVARFEQCINDFADKGVWKPGIFRKWNVVTFGGSIWIAQRDTTVKPGDGADWRLAVKRGRDGSDAKPEEIAKHLLPDVLAALDRK